MPVGRGSDVRELAAGAGWRVSDIRCDAGPSDAPFEEAHDRVAVVAVLAGSFVYRSTHGRALMAPGAWLLGNPGACFCCAHEHGRGDRCVAFHFDPEAIDGFAGGLRRAGRTVGFRRHRIPPVDALLALQATVRAAVARPDPLLLEETAHRAAHAALRLGHDAEEARATPADEARMAAAVALIERGFAEPLSVAGLAEAVGISRFHFVRVFRRTVGVTPYAFVLNRRLAAAAEVLRAGDAGILEVALSCGFGDLSEFTRRFRTRFGRTPSAFRAAAR